MSAGILLPFRLASVNLHAHKLDPANLHAHCSNYSAVQKLQDLYIAGAEHVVMMAPPCWATCRCCSIQSALLALWNE